MIKLKSYTQNIKVDNTARKENMTVREDRDNKCILQQAVSPEIAYTLTKLGFTAPSYFQHALVADKPRPGEHIILRAWTLTELIPHVVVTDAQCTMVMRSTKPVTALANILIKQLTEERKKELEELNKS